MCEKPMSLFASLSPSFPIRGGRLGLLFASALLASGCAAADEAGGDASGSNSGTLTGGKGDTSSPASDAPYGASCVVGSEYTPVASLYETLAGIEIPYRLAIRKRHCSYARGCEGWQELDALHGAPLTGVAALSPMTSGVNLWLRFDGEAAVQPDGGTRKLVNDCLVERAWKNDYEPEDFGVVRCGSFDVADLGVDGSYHSSDPGAPYLGFIGSLTADCIDQHAVSNYHPQAATEWDEWEGALYTNF